MLPQAVGQAALDLLQAANRRRHRGCRAGSRRSRCPRSRDGSAITSTLAAALFWRRLSVSSATCAGWTRTREISCPRSFSRAPRTRPCRASGSMASSRRRTRRAMARESWTRSASASARRRARRPPISSMERARRSMTGCISAAARWRPAASPSRRPAAWASRARCSYCCCNCASRCRESGGSSAGDSDARRVRRAASGARPAARRRMSRPAGAL